MDGYRYRYKPADDAVIHWEIVEDPEPDPVVDAWLDYMSELGKIADTYAFYIGPAVDTATIPKRQEDA